MNFLTSKPAGANEEACEPLRGELFSIDHLRGHALMLAKSQTVQRKPAATRQFFRQFQDNAQRLRTAHAVVSRAIHNGQPISPDAEWLLDNFYVVQQQLHEIQDDLPVGYFRELPKLSDGKPRILQLAEELIIHTDSVIQQDDLVAFVNEYQSVAPLSIGELWALPIMLRLALVENLRRLAEHLVATLTNRERVRRQLRPWRPNQPLPEPLQGNGPPPAMIVHAFAAAQDLFEDDPARGSALDQLLTEQFPASTDLVRAEHRRQAANQVSIGNVITSMRLITALDWTSFFEQTSLVERMLRTDPSGTYPQMDAETRDRYRHVIEELAKQSGHPELIVTDRALSLAQAAKPLRRSGEISAHVGYWLVDDGRKHLELELGFRPKLRQRIQRAMRDHPQITYFGSITLLTLGLLGFVGRVLVQGDVSSLAIAVILCLALLPISEIAVSLTNLIITHLLPPRILPKLEFKDGIAPNCRTFVVVPALLTSKKEVAALVDRLELHYVSNPDPELCFALLTDFADSATEYTDMDEELGELAVAGIRRLNSVHGTKECQPFYLFHRSRKWNPAEGVWMGWERKRGKLMEFNRLLLGAMDTSYTVQEGDLTQLKPLGRESAFPFVITLDADTQLPLGVARRLIGTLAHPLNRPQLSASGKKVVHGYTILQPRVSVSLSEGGKSCFARLFANAKGIDPYATAASDVYQDLFDEGIFTGKGIYDVRMFETTLGTAFGENQILSHDLIEGCHARVALTTDIEVIDGYPSRYDAEARRAHRWVRGDWQLLPWLLPEVPSAHGARPNCLSLLSRWKIFDNLRRSLVAPFTLVLLLVAWYHIPHDSALISLIAALCIGWPVMGCVLNTLMGMPWPNLWLTHLRAAAKDLLRSIGQSAVLAACVPHKACLMLDAVVRTLYRLAVSRQRLLEWETAASTEQRLSRREWNAAKDIAFVPVLAILIAATIPRIAWLSAAPWLVAWISSPVITYVISRPILAKRLELAKEDREWLRQLARQTWSYFETYVSPQTNWLPPDNFQEYPDDRLAERISPTNQGLFLMSALVARDFGFIGMHDVVELWEKNLEAWRKLPQLRGHFYNWYETSTLRPLMPRYVSTVDSGNLAASFLVLKRGTDELCHTPLFGKNVWQGLGQTIDSAIQACEALQPRGARMISPPLDELTASLNRLRVAANGMPERWPDRWRVLGELREAERSLPRQLQALIDSKRHATSVLQGRIASVQNGIAGLEADLHRLVPWLQHYVELVGINSARAALPAQQEAWRQIQEHVESAASLDQLAALAENLENLDALKELAEPIEILSQWKEEIAAGAAHAAQLAARCREVGRLSEEMALGMDFEFLYNHQRQLFSIGYNLEEGQLDRSHYDMLCSEARLSSHFAIAKGDVSYKHWFQLGRQTTLTAGRAGLVSWAGTMFEFLMPLLFQKSYPDSLLSQACEVAVARQREYGRQCRVPWGISESAFGAMAANSDYCYQSFGVPGLGLKRGMKDDLVVAPYATMLALPLDPAAAVANLRELTREGVLGSYGFYDAVEYTPGRVPSGQRNWPVRCYMAHHQAMSLTAIANLLLDHVIERRFHAHPMIRATEMLLQEAIPTAAPVLLPLEEEATEAEPIRPEAALVSRRTGWETPWPRTHLLSNGNYGVMVTNTGGGFSRHGAIDVNRWRPDDVRDNGGHWFYLRERRTSDVWSATYQPTCKRPDSYEAMFCIDKAEFRRRDGDIETHLEITVSPDENVEVRQLKITNHGWRPCELEITSYVEVSLTTQAADLAHPAFQKLFVETEYIAEEAALLARRRPRDSQTKPLWGVHVLATAESAGDDIQYESSREKFLGRGRDLSAPAALQRDARLSGTVGIVLDPIFSLRTTVVVGRNASVTVAFTTGVAESREEALRLADQFHEYRSVHRAFEMSWVFNQVQLRHLHLSAVDAQRCQQLAALLIYPHPMARGTEMALRKNRQGQRALWRFGISGDRPILYVKVAETEQVGFVRELILAHQYWRHLGLDVDLVLSNLHPGSYLDALQEQLQRAVQELSHQSPEDKTSIFLLRAAQTPLEDQWLLEAAAHVVLDAKQGWSTLRAVTSKGHLPAAETTARSWPISRIDKRRAAKSRLPTSAVVEQVNPVNSKSAEDAKLSTHKDVGLEFWNGLGGFGAQGREYHIRLTASSRPPAPWSNVIANPRFGTLVTEGGGGYTWAENSRQNKLTTWSNDPVTDFPSEILFLRDDVSREIRQPLSPPRQRESEHWVHHGQGFSRFQGSSHDLDWSAVVTIAPDDPVKFIHLTLRNNSNVDRQLTAAYYAELVLGVTREQTQLYLTTEAHQEPGTLLIRNPFHSSSPDQVAFLRTLGLNPSITGDRVSFWGRNGDRSAPTALRDYDLNGTTGVGLDPCGAVQCHLTVAPGGKADVVFLFGCGADAVETHQLLQKYSSLQSVQAAIEETQSRWNQLLTAVQVKTPDRALDLLVNRWLLYQVTSCRLWGRSAFYQAGGAYGFRDQLQDVMALVYARPDLAREQLLRAAARQFAEGDVQHWWHPPLGEGTRTRFSDDLLWLPFVTAHYVEVTGDNGVLDELVSYLHSSRLAANEQERYELPQVSSQSGTLYEHCLRALEHGLKFGEHGLPLMGCGDWNDGMNHVGALGKGESVWVGWFLLVLLDHFLPIVEQRDGRETVDRYLRIAADLKQSLETHGWDGQWYRRAFFDDGTPLGSQENDECQIDSIAQSWAVMAQANPQRTTQAINSVFDRLVSWEHRLVALFAPPFDKTVLDPGYIKGYLPGVRENGGQYTHAVLWLVQALSLQGDGHRAHAIFDAINPIRHATTASQIQTYCLEPYVVAADVYSMPPHTGRGGWSWYTGSASWMYRVALESILGLRLRNKQVQFQPCIPADWERFEVSIRLGGTHWKFTIVADAAAQGADGFARRSFVLVDDGHEHHEEIRIRRSAAKEKTPTAMAEFKPITPQTARRFNEKEHSHDREKSTQ